MGYQRMRTIVCSIFFSDNYYLNFLFQGAYHAWKNKFDELGLYSGFAHDALVAMVLALNHSAGVLAAKNKSLADFTYSDSEMAGLFKKSLSNVSFRGFSVREPTLRHSKISLVP